MTHPSPIYLGSFQAKYHGSVVDEYIDVSADLSVEGEHIDAVAFEVVLDSDQDEPLVDVIPEAGVTLSEKRVDFQINVPATVGTYQLTAWFTISDGTHFPKIATFYVS